MVVCLSRNFEEADNGIRFLQSDGCNPDFVELCHELDVFLKPEYRGRGISKKLMAQLENDAKENELQLFDSGIWRATCGGHGIV